MLLSMNVPDSELGDNSKFRSLIQSLERGCIVSPNFALNSSQLKLKAANDKLDSHRRAYYEVMIIYEVLQKILDTYERAASQSISDENYELKTTLQGSGLRQSLKTYKALEVRLETGKAAQCLRLPCTTSSSNHNQDGNQGKNKIHALGLAVSTDHILGIKPSSLKSSELSNGSEDSSYQAELRADVEASLKREMKQLAAFWESESSDVGGGTMPQLSSNIEGAVMQVCKDQANSQEQLRSIHHYMTRLFNVLDDNLNILQSLAQEFRVVHQQNFEKKKGEWLSKKIHALQLKLRALEVQVLRETYNQQTNTALRILRTRLIEKLDEETRNLNTVMEKVQQFQQVDPQFNEIAGHYRDLVSKLKHVEWTISEVERDY